MSKEEYQKAKELCGDGLVGLLEEMNDYCAAHGKKYKDYLAAIRTWWKKRIQSNKFIQEDKIKNRKDWAEGIAKKVGAKARFEVYPEVVIFKGSGPTPDLVIRFVDHGFEDQVINRLRKMGINAIDERS